MDQRTSPQRVVLGRAIFCLAAAVGWLTVVGCGSGLPSTGTGLHSCADCAQAAACCQAVLTAMDAAAFECSSSEMVCDSIDDLELQRENISDCDAYLMAHAATADAAACQ
jgi:hypothetical protein